MNLFRLTCLSACMILVCAISFTFTRADSSAPNDAPLDRGRFVMPFGISLDTRQRVLSFEDDLDADDEDVSGQSASGGQVTSKFDPEKAWLLDPDTFNQLSSAGQRAVLSLNGRLRHPRANRELYVPQSEVSAEAAAGDNIRVNNPALDTSFHTHSETSIAVNGSTIIVSFNEASFDGYGISTDGGASFTHKRIPVPSGGSNLGDGVVCFGPNGEVYYATLASVPSGSSTKSIVGVAKSTDNGATFTPPVDASTIVSNTTDFQDKEWVAADRNQASPNKGNVYVSWTDFLPGSNGSFVRFSRSTNGGTSFEAPLALSPQDKTSQVQGSVPLVAPNGDLYVAFRDSHSAIGGIGIVKSTDGGATFGAERSVAHVSSVSTMTGGGSVRTNSFPSAAVDNSGNLYVAYAGFSAGQTLDRSDVFMTRSTDGGNSWSTPVKINDDGTTTSQFMPSVTVATDGTIGVKWWDRRNDPINDSLTDVYMATSVTGGATFGKNFRVTNHNWAFGPIEIGFASGYHGDYDGIAASGGNFFLSWSDERNGESDAYFAQEPTNRDPGIADFNISAVKPFDSLVAGQSIAFDLSTSGTNGFSGMLDLAASPAINGLGFGFSNSPVSAGTSSSLNQTTTSGVQPNTYLITASAGASGVTRKTNYRLSVFDPNRFAGMPVDASRTKGFTTMQGGLSVAADGTVHVAFDDDSANVRNVEVFYRRSPDGGTTFSTPVKVSGTNPFAFESTLALDQAGNPFVAWTGFNPTIGGFSVFLSKSIDHGNTFLNPVVASGNSTDAENAKVAFDKNGNVYIAYVDFSQSGTPVFAARSTDGGVTFSPPLRVSQAGETLGNPPYIAADSTGAAYVTYQDSSQSIATIKLAIAPAGQAFGLPKVISNPATNAFAPQIAIDANDNVFATFYNRLNVTSSTFNREIVVIKSTDKGNTFGAQLNVSNNAGQSTFPTLILGAQGRMAIAWEDTTVDPQRDAYVARSTDGGMNFEFPLNLSSNSGRSFGAFGGIDGNGKVTVGWTDDSGANTELFFATVPPGAAPAPDFGLGFDSSQVTVDRGTKFDIPVNITRTSGFSGSVTVTGPDTGSGKIRLLTDPQETTGTSVSFRFKIKGGAPVGSRPLVFSASDSTGRTHSATLTMIIQ